MHMQSFLTSLIVSVRGLINQKISYHPFPPSPSFVRSIVLHAITSINRGRLMHTICPFLPVSRIDIFLKSQLLVQSSCQAPKKMVQYLSILVVISTLDVFLMIGDPKTSSFEIIMRHLTLLMI